MMLGHTYQNWTPILTQHVVKKAFYWQAHQENLLCRTIPVLIWLCQEHSHRSMNHCIWWPNKSRNIHPICSSSSLFWFKISFFKPNQIRCAGHIFHGHPTHSSQDNMSTQSILTPRGEIPPKINGVFYEFKCRKPTDDEKENCEFCVDW